MYTSLQVIYIEIVITSKSWRHLSDLSATPSPHLVGGLGHAGTCHPWICECSAHETTFLAKCFWKLWHCPCNSERKKHFIYYKNGAQQM